MSFKTDLVVKRNVKKDNCWIVQEPLIWEDEKHEIRVLKGFDFDFASIPNIITNILPKDGQEYDRAACLHDALYSSQRLPKSECDRLFYEAMLFDGVNKFKAKSMYLAVKLFGGMAYSSADYTDYYKSKVILGVKG